MSRLLYVSLLMIITCSAIVIDVTTPLNCGRNEKEICTTGCPPSKKCENRDVQYACPAVVLPCTRTCECKEGYFRNAIGECITKAECAKCSKPNEFFSCGSACDNDCKTIGKQSRKKCPIKNIVCNKRCYCKDGFARDARGNCIPIEQCNKNQCLPNEVRKCVKKCPYQRTCRRPIVNYLCVRDPKPCKYKCVCAEGYLRNSIGECITAKQCCK